MDGHGSAGVGGVVCHDAAGQHHLSGKLLAIDVASPARLGRRVALRGPQGPGRRRHVQAGLRVSEGVRAAAWLESHCDAWSAWALRAQGRPRRDGPFAALNRRKGEPTHVVRALCPATPCLVPSPCPAPCAHVKHNVRDGAGGFIQTHTSASSNAYERAGIPSDHHVALPGRMVGDEGRGRGKGQGREWGPNDHSADWMRMARQPRAWRKPPSGRCARAPCADARPSTWRGQACFTP
jgi:hypothetical protein